jgi:hypothetical protein
VTRELPAVGAVAGRAKKSSAFWTTLSARTLTDGGVGKVWLDGRRALNLDRSVAQIGAPTAWRAGWTGSGV